MRVFDKRIGAEQNDNKESVKTANNARNQGNV